MDKIKILIADDHTMVREAFRRLLGEKPGIEVVGEAKNGKDAISKTDETQPDVVLMDIIMPDMDGFETIRRIKQVHPDINILVLSAHGNDEVFLKALSAGCSGYVIKSASSRELDSAIKVVAGGGTYLHPTMTKKLVNAYLREVDSGTSKVYEQLTEREKSVLKMLAESRNNREIAEILKLSRNTVQTHRARLMMKLRIHNRTDLVRYAIRQGLVSLDKRPLPTDYL